MNIIFGMHLDNSDWSNQQASIGEIRTGPNGFINILETQLGLSKPLIHPALRINEYMNRLKEIDNETMWFHESFSVDPWSTSKQFLQWRDELIEAGWQSKLKIEGSPRLNCLSDIEIINKHLPDGRSDRLNEVVNCIKKGSHVKIRSISLLEPLNILPHVWQKLIKLLRKQGTRISEYEKTELQDDTINLNRVQAIISGKAVHSPLLSSDDSLILLKADNEWEAAEHIALWLSSKTEDNDKITMICSKDTFILDQALKRYGLPCLGRLTPSCNRENQQILPLMLANVWKPIDIRLMVELLSLNSTPFPRWVCQYLLNAINKEPGIGGYAWNEALDKIYEKYNKYLHDNGDKNSEENSKKFVQEIQSLLVEDRYDALEGIPEDKLRERCQKIINLISPQLRTEKKLAEVVSHAQLIQTISKEKVRIKRTTLERIIESVIGAGSISDEVIEEAAYWRVVNHPGQIVDSCENIIWWGFNENSIHKPTYWSKHEIDALNKYSIFLEDSKNFRFREKYYWNHGFLKAKKRFIGISIAQLYGEEAYHHPYWDTILCAATETVNLQNEDFLKTCLIKQCKDFINNEWRFAGRTNALKKVSKRITKPITPSYTVLPSLINYPARLSYSQMNTLISCPFKWALEYHVELRLPESHTIPTGNQMIGRLCHRIIEELYKSKKQIEVAAAVTEADKLYDNFIPSMASELLLDGNAVERKRYKKSIINAIKQLVTTINRHKLSVDSTEAMLGSQIENIPFIGFADMLLSDEVGNKYILDLKWSSSSKYRKQEIEEGRAVQLAAYAWMQSSLDPSKQVNTGYFMLAQAQLLSNSLSFNNDVLKSAYTMQEIWEMAVASMKEVFRQFSTGLIEVRGIIEKLEAINYDKNEDKIKEEFEKKYRDNRMLYQSPPCNFCDFSLLCGLNGGML